MFDIFLSKQLPITAVEHCTVSWNFLQNFMIASKAFMGWHNIHNFSLLSRQSVCIHLRFARISTICSVPRYIRRSHAIYDVQTKEIKPRNKQSTLIFCTGDTDELLLYTVWFCPCLVFLRGMTCA